MPRKLKVTPLSRYYTSQEKLTSLKLVVEWASNDPDEVSVCLPHLSIPGDLLNLAKIISGLMRSPTKRKTKKAKRGGN